MVDLAIDDPMGGGIFSHTSPYLDYLDGDMKVKA